MSWQEEIRSLQNNYNVALTKFNVLKERLKRNPDLRKKCEDIINDYLEKGYTKNLSKEE